ncbi:MULTISPECIES: OB-fold domain-containing protein [Streptomyces]|uniref:Zn-ribbon domain-containing OB-fold protein n=1 Tax=Streptomyces TaxID=1883 RepID=UPI0007C7FEDE|nr:MULTISPECIES: OB-fold domain-containing protein [Streptomyces]MDI5906469.1 OB-fold domain-containing protein [Streptomyces sp. 12257]
MTASIGKPVPVPTEIDRPYWDALREHRVVLSRCVSCGWYSQRRKMLCQECHGEEFTWAEISGRGTIYSFTRVHQTWVTAFQDDTPYVLVSVALEEQPSLVLVTNLLGDYDFESLELGLPVIADFEPRGNEIILQFRLAGGTDVQ